MTCNMSSSKKLNVQSDLFMESREYRPLLLLSTIIILFQTSWDVAQLNKIKCIQVFESTVTKHQ